MVIVGLQTGGGGDLWSIANALSHPVLLTAEGCFIFLGPAGCGPAAMSVAARQL